MSDEPDPDPDRPLLLSHAIRVFFPMGGMTVSGLRKERDRGTLAVYRMAGRDYTTISAMREMMERCKVQPPERRAPSPRPSLQSRRDKQESEAARAALLKTLDDLKAQERVKREKEKAERKAERDRARGKRPDA